MRGGYRPSLKTSARWLACALLACAALFSITSVGLLHEIATDASSTYGKEIPYLLDRNRNAIKIERLASFLRTVALTNDPSIERRLLLQIQTLAQSFAFDDDARLSRSATQAVSSAREIIAVHARERQLAPGPDRRGSTAPQAVEKLRQDADEAVGRAIRDLDAATDYLITDAALLADRTAAAIQGKTARVQRDWFVALALCGLLGSVLAWICQRHILRPITVADRGLRAISGSDAAAVTLPRALFLELDVIARAIEAYARFSADLRDKNVALHELSQRDGLTGLANRRSFDDELDASVEHVRLTGGDLALLLVDIDHFKRLNDRCGHLAGDECLRQVALALSSAASARDAHVSRYGGEEFAIILRAPSAKDATAHAERFRLAVESARTCLPGLNRPVSASVSIGLSTFSSECRDSRALIEAADRALYRAKRSGRNCVRVAAPEEPPAVAAPATLLSAGSGF